MVRHDDVRVQEVFSLSAIVEDGSFKQFRSGRNLKEAAAFGCHRGNEIRPNFLGREPHLSSIIERPEAKANLISILRSGA
jgi:cytochrome c2